MTGTTHDLVQKIAVAIGATDEPPMKGGITYRIIVFKVTNTGHWVAGMIPEIVEVEELFVVINESYDMFLKGATTPNGIVFICAEQPEELITLAQNWYYGHTPSQSTPSTETYILRSV